ncbi:MAG: (deoxy)nucleoside triphosphate pyrophosphohydrolase [Holophaga sp.]|jgi:8-oxo-dGTP diphosphatase
MTDREVALALIVHRGRCFAQQRSPLSRHLPGLWEFPGGKVEPLESPRAALFRELEEEVRWAPARAAALPPVVHAYPQFRVTLHPFLCHGIPARTPSLETALAWGWFTPAELGRLPMPEANRELLGRLALLVAPD